MSAVRTILRRRRDRRESARRGMESRTRRFALGFGFVLSILLALLILGTAFYYAELTRDLPSVQTLPGLLNPPDGLLLQPTRVYDRSGPAHPENLRADRIPAPLHPDRPAAIRSTCPTRSCRPPSPWPTRPSGNIPATRWLASTTPTCIPPSRSNWSATCYCGTKRLPCNALSASACWPRRSHPNTDSSQVIEWYLNSANYGNYAYGADAAAATLLRQIRCGIDSRRIRDISGCKPGTRLESAGCAPGRPAARARDRPHHASAGISL